MSAHLTLDSRFKLGIVPTHIRFVGGLVPDEAGSFPRDEDGVILTVAEMRRICGASPVAVTCVQVPYFAGARASEMSELVAGLKELDLEVQLILMVGGANPMNPADEDAVLAQLVPALKVAAELGVSHVSSTSIEEWMSTSETRREGAAYEAAIAQNVKLHVRAYREAGLEGSSVKSWHIEFLRPGEFKTFNCIRRGRDFVTAANAALGKSFFKVLVDAAHCGDSGLSMQENAQVITDLAAAGELGLFHCSAKTTRGCFSTDDGWIGALLTAAAATGRLEHVFVEIFDHADPALEMLRKLDPGHGIDTRDGRSYSELAVDSLVEIAHRLNNLVARGRV